MTRSAKPSARKPTHTSESLLKLLSRGSVQHDVHIVVELKERRGQLRRQRTVHHALDTPRLRSSSRQQHDRARMKNRRHSYRERLRRNVCGIAAEQRRVTAAGFWTERHAM